MNWLLNCNEKRLFNSVAKDITSLRMEYILFENGKELGPERL